MNENIADAIAISLVILALCLGIGGCSYLCAKADNLSKTTVEGK